MGAVIPILVGMGCLRKVAEYEPKSSQVAASLHALCVSAHGQVLVLNPFSTFLP